MGLADLILGNANPIAQFLDANGNKIRGLGAGFASGQNFSQGLANAAQGAAQGAPVDQQLQIASQGRNQTANYLHIKGYDDLIPLVLGGQGTQAMTIANQRDQNAFTMSQPKVVGRNGALVGQDGTPLYQSPTGAGTASVSDQINQRLAAGKQQNLSGTALTTFALTGKLPGGNQGTRGSLGSTVPYRNTQTGKLVAGQLMSDGTVLDPQTHQPIGPEFEYDPYALNAAKTGGQVDAKTAAAARAALPAAEQNYQFTMQALSNFDPGTTNDAAKGVRAGEDEQFGKFLGMPTGQIIPAIPGTNKANFQNIIKQLSGQAFLNIRNALKGAGQVTDYEGAKGEAAISRMELAANSGDQAAFQQALADYTQALDNGMSLLRQQANAQNSADPSAVPGMPPGQGTSDTTYTYNPSTGNLE